MAIQVRRGIYTDFSPSKMVAGEFADVYSGDPNTTAGTALYICFAPGKVGRIITEADIDDVKPSYADPNNDGNIVITGGD